MLADGFLCWIYHSCWDGLLLICADELDASGLSANGCKDDDGDEGAEREDRQGCRVIWCRFRPGILRQDRFKEDDERGEEVAQLIGKARECATYIRGREFVQVYGYDSPCSLHHKLQEECANGY